MPTIIEITSSTTITKLHQNHVSHCDTDTEGGLFLSLVVSSTTITKLHQNLVIHFDTDTEGGLFLYLVVSSTSLAPIQTFLYRILGQVS